MPWCDKDRLCSVILADSRLPHRNVLVTADEGRRLLIWVGRRRLGEPAQDDFTLELAVTAHGADALTLTDPSEVLGLNRRTSDRRCYKIDRRAAPASD